MRNTKIQEKYDAFVAYFQEHRPVAETELVYRNPYELLVAVILSAQCTDKRVNMTTPALFGRFPTPEAMASSTVEEILAYIKTISYPNSKAQHLLGMAKMLVEAFDGKVPETLEDLQRLPGVGRKTANVMMAVAFDQPAMPVDTHVFRVANRIGLTKNSKNVLETEKTLVAHFPEKVLSTAHHWLILHGRYVCLARKPRCEQCGINELCDFYQKKIGKKCHN
ncbi:MAG: endonuclease III [Bacteroidales bacterium]|nr:endonuclease III [Bacteroidales bacterium]